MKLKLVNIVDEAPDVKSFFWEPNEKLNFEPGQYFYYTFPKLNYEDERGPTRHFTLSNSPTEELLRVTTKFPEPMSGYKKTLLELKVGDTIDGRGPQGVFVLPNNYSLVSNYLFIAGGIGITPFRSMIKYCVDNNLDLPHLIYCNSDANFVFKDELKMWLGDNLKLVDTSKSGHIDKVFFENLDSRFSLLDSSVYVVGPPKFVDAIEESLKQLGIESGKIVTEKFTGY